MKRKRTPKKKFDSTNPDHILRIFRRDIEAAVTKRKVDEAANPKHAQGVAKVPLELIPAVVKRHLALALLDGKGKYGRHNWRGTQVVASIYKAASERHWDDWFEGQEADAKSGLHPVAHALACAAIVLDAQTEGTLVDDRMFSRGGYLAKAVELNAHAARLVAMHADKSPKHWDRRDMDKALQKAWDGMAKLAEECETKVAEMLAKPAKKRPPKKK